MKLLIITQKINKKDQVLGFFHAWIKEFSKHFESIIGICLEKGEYDLPPNVKVLSLGKEQGISRVKYLFNFYKYIWEERNNYDVVFVHMNPIYVVMAGLLWKMLSKPIFLWYTHKSVDSKLKIAEVLVSKIFSASKESFRLPSNKLEVFGHGIDTDFFKPIFDKQNEYYIILSVGRVSKTKNQLMMVEAIDSLVKDYPNLKLIIVGGPITEDDKIYKNQITKRVKELKLDNFVGFTGAIPQEEIINFYQNSDLFINLSSTGSLDKAVLEAMSCGSNILTSNEAFKNILPKECLTTNDQKQIIDKIRLLIDKKPNLNLREYVVANHRLDILVSKISTEIKKHEHIHSSK